MKTILTGLCAAFLALSMLGTPAFARHHARHHHIRHYRTYRATTSGYYYDHNGVRHTRPHGDLDKFSRSFNHEVNNASKSVNHAFQGKKPTPKGYK